jgi:16S rRNA (guanine966-N2)-methyltransferase
VTLVERAPAAAAACRANAAVLRRSAPGDSSLHIEVITQNVQSFLTNASGAWDIAFLDPPYDLTEPDLAATLTALGDRLAPDAMVMLERSSRSSEPAWPAGITVERRKTYGDTTLWWARAAQ